MLASADAIRIKVKRLRRLLLKQLNGKLGFHPGPQKRCCQKNIYKAVHDSRWALGLIRKTVHRAQRMVETGSRLERHVGCRTQANEFDHALGSRKLVGRLASRPNLGSAPAPRHRRNALATTQRRYEERPG